MAGYNESVFGIPFFSIGGERFWGVDRMGHALAYLGCDHALVTRLTWLHQPMIEPANMDRILNETVCAKA